jgi:hypothetical protein
MEIDITKGIDGLLRHNNVNILSLLLREGIVKTEFIIDRAKKLYVALDEIFETTIIDFFCESEICDQELAQICLELLFKSTGDGCYAIHILPIDTIKKLMIYGAVIPMDAINLSKLPYDEFIKQIESNNIKVDLELEKQCLKFSNIEILKWIRQNSCENIDIITKIFSDTNCILHKNELDFYFNETQSHDYVTDNMIIAMIYRRMFNSAIVSPNYIINEELSFFIVLFFSVSIHNGKPMQETLFKLLHSNINKYIGSGVSEYFRNIDETNLLLINTLHPASKTYDTFREDVFKNARTLLDYAESMFVFDN